jgi:hypothetical protein
MVTPLSIIQCHLYAMIAKPVSIPLSLTLSYFLLIISFQEELTGGNYYPSNTEKATI